MATIYIDGKYYKVNESDNLLKVCLSLGFDIPYFCWHPILGSVGACRQCAVKKYNNSEDTNGKLVMSCMTPATNNSVISIQDEEVIRFRRMIIECLMINHPHDCPVCEEGGNCHLQDMTVMTGHNIRKYRFMKRTHRNQYLGPFISHEMNRCITCYRCIRYYQDYAGGKDLGVYGIHNNIYFGRIKDGTLENEFSGNLVEICPTGVFTDKSNSERYHRKWDIQFAPSICQHCSIGCNTSPGERYGELCKIENRYNGSVNHYFLCDLGRFGYDYVNLKNRPKNPLQRIEKNWIPLNIKQAIDIGVDLLSNSNRIIGIGSPRASIESNFALRELVGEENFYSGIGINEQNSMNLILNILNNSGIHTPSLREIESYDAILVLGEDLTQTGARMALALRQAVKGKALDLAAKNKIYDWQISAVMNIGQNLKRPLFITNVDKTKLDDIAAWSYYAPISDQARLGFAIAHALDKTAPFVKDLDKKLKIKIDIIARALITASKPLIISGSSSGSESILAAAANIARSLKRRGKSVGISFIASGPNSMGLAMIGGKSLDEALISIEQGSKNSIIILENDIYRYAPSSIINNAMKKVHFLIVLDHQKNLIHEKANLILSSASFVESDGTLVNQEGRAQRFFRVYDPTYYDNKVIILESWRWLHLLHSTYLNRKVYWKTFDHVVDAVANVLPHLSAIKNVSPQASFRIHGQKLAREPNRYSGRTAIHSNRNVHEPRVSQDNESMFSFSMEGNNDPIAPRQHIAFAWAPGWNSPQSWNKFQDEVGGHLYHGDPGIRLIEARNGTLDWFNIIPSSYISESNINWIIAPYWHLFGSEEMSQKSKIIQKRIPIPYVMINKEDAIILGINKNCLLSFNCFDHELSFIVKISDNLSRGQLGLPLGFPGIPPIFSGYRVKKLRKKLDNFFD